MGNKDKAIFLLKKALNVQGLEDRDEVREKLDEIYAELGLQAGSGELLVDENSATGSDLDLIAQRLWGEQERGLTPAGWPHGMEGEIKIGRNETCPCGSGKKFKKCCGN